jgi:transcriptional regulator with XRE-family HTH domain
MNRIDAIKKERHLSYGDISKCTGLTTAYICMLAKGQKKNPSKETMEKIAAAFDKTVADVFFPKIRDKTIKKTEEII